jgi:BolA protein
MSISDQIAALLTDHFQPIYVEVENESHRHRAGKEAETHFKVTIVSDHFEGKKLLDRHRLIYECLAGPLKSGVHALAIHSFTNSEWASSQKVNDSPHCRGGSGK